MLISYAPPFSSLGVFMACGETGQKFHDEDKAKQAAKYRSERTNKTIYVFPCGDHFHLTKLKRKAKAH